MNPVLRPKIMVELWRQAVRVVRFSLIPKVPISKLRTLMEYLIHYHSNRSQTFKWMPIHH